MTEPHLLGDSFVRGWPADLPVPYNGPFRARVVEVHDGDTLTLEAATCFGRSEVVVRVYGINSPELSTPEGVEARDYAQALLPAGTPVRFTPLLSSAGELVETFGRVVGSVEYVVSMARQPIADLATTMVLVGHAKWCDRNLRPLLPGPLPPIPRWRQP